MKMQREMADTSRCMEKIVSTVEELESVLLVAFGPCGQAVLVQQPTGQFTITRSGLDILTAYFPSPQKNPYLRVLLDCVRTLHKDLGDGVKCFIFMLAALLRKVRAVHRPSFIARELTLLQLRISILFNSSIKIDHLCGECNFLISIVNTFLSSRFPSSVVSILAPLLAEWIKMNLLKGITLTSLLHNFILLCIHQGQGCKSVSYSRIQNGYYVSRRALNLKKSGNYAVTTLILGDSDADNRGSLDDLDIQCEVNRVIQEHKATKKESKDNILGILLLTSAVLPDLSVFCLGREGVSIVQGIPFEEMSYIHSVLMTLQHSADTDCLVLAVKSETVGSKEYTWLDLPNVSQLILSAPTPEICLLYSQACNNALKLVSVFSSQLLSCSNIPLAYRAGGYFEMFLYKFLCSEFNIDILHHNLVRNRSELLARLKHQTAQGGRVNNINFNNEEHNLFPMTSVSSTVCDNNTEDHHNVASVFKYIYEAFHDVNSELMESLVQMFLAIPQKLPPHVEPVTRSADTIYLEPLSLRLMIVQHVLGAAATLLRITGTLNVMKQNSGKKK